MLSSSVNAKSGDQEMTIQDRIYYIFNCLRNNLKLIPEKGRHGLRVRNSILNPLLNIDGFISFRESPLRTLCDAFLVSFPWEKLYNALGHVKLLDIGCGSGEYFNLYNSILGEKVISYTGIDIIHHEEWNNISNEKVTFKMLSAEDVDSLNISKFNLIVSTTALEHIEHDLLFFQKVSSHIKKYNQKLLQIHFVPSPITMIHYPWHGYRQYNLTSFHKIAALFPSSKISVFPLGGMLSSLITPFFITIPKTVLFYLSGRQDISSYLPDFYKLLLQKIYSTEYLKSSKIPIIYCLVIESNMGESIFPTEIHS